MTVSKVWVNPAHGTSASRRALRAAGNAVEESEFRRARPRQLRKPKVYNLDGVGKNDPWAANLETPVVPEYRGRKANYRSGTASVGKRYSGASTGTGGPKKVQPTRVAGRKTPGAGITMRDESKPPIDPSLIGKVYTEHNGHEWRDDDGNWGRGPSPIPNASKRVRRFSIPRGGNQVGKRDRAYNPEHNRQRRLGIATAATGIGGAASLGAGGLAVRNTSRHVDAGRSSLKVKAKQPGTKKEAREVMEALADREKNGLMLVSRRTRGKLGLGAGLLGTSAGLHHYSRGRSNREWR